MKESLPLFYFKPSICWIDDDQLFLNAVKIAFENKYHCLTFSDPNKAIEYINQYQSFLSKLNFKREFIENDIYGTVDHYPVDINIPVIRSLCDVDDKSNEIAVVVFDYNMPSTTGIDFCKQIHNPSIKKILLTGEATLENAIEAFNLNIIDKFIEKGNQTYEVLDLYLKELVKDYFLKKSLDLISHLETAGPSILTDVSFIRFFNDWRNENLIEEYYLINTSGSFLVKNKYEKLSYFVVMSEKNKKEFLDLHDDLSQDNPYLKALENGNMIPFFGPSKEPSEIHIDNWESYFHPAKTIQGRELYYWCHVIL